MFPGLDAFPGTGDILGRTAVASATVRRPRRPTPEELA